MYMSRCHYFVTVIVTIKIAAGELGKYMCRTPKEQSRELAKMHKVPQNAASDLSRKKSNPSTRLPKVDDSTRLPGIILSKHGNSLHCKILKSDCRLLEVLCIPAIYTEKFVRDCSSALTMIVRLCLLLELMRGDILDW